MYLFCLVIGDVMYNKRILLLSILLLIHLIIIAVILYIPSNIENPINIGSYDETQTYVIENKSLVWISKTGKKYHLNPDCSNMKNPLQITIEEAEIRDYIPCKKCY